METEATECYYCPWAIDDLQTCIKHVVKTHGEKPLKADQCAALRSVRICKITRVIQEIMTLSLHLGK